jgi:hypothetical protein
VKKTLVGGRTLLAYVARPARFRLAGRLSRFNPSRARRLAVRTSAAARDAFFARADRSSGVIFLADVLPPCRPNMRAISVMAARTSGGILIHSMVHLTGYGENGGGGRGGLIPNPLYHALLMGDRMTGRTSNVLERRVDKLDRKQLVILVAIRIEFRAPTDRTDTPASC